MTAWGQRYEIVTIFVQNHLSTRPTRSYTFSDRTARDRSATARGFIAVQTAQPRDVGALIFVIGLFLVLLVVTLATSPGPPAF